MRLSCLAGFCVADHVCRNRRKCREKSCPATVDTTPGPAHETNERARARGSLTSQTACRHRDDTACCAMTTPGRHGHSGAGHRLARSSDSPHHASSIGPRSCSPTRAQTRQNSTARIHTASPEPSHSTFISVHVSLSRMSCHTIGRAHDVERHQQPATHPPIHTEIVAQLGAKLAAHTK